MKKIYELQELSKLISIHIRNSMQDFCHLESLSDKEMEVLSPIIRDSIYTVLCALHKSKNGNLESIEFINFLENMYPKNWRNSKINENSLR